MVCGLGCVDGERRDVWLRCSLPRVHVASALEELGGVVRRQGGRT